MPTLQLSTAERDALMETLDAAVSELGMQIADTDRLGFRDQLKQRRDHLRRVRTKLSVGVAPGKAV